MHRLVAVVFVVGCVAQTTHPLSFTDVAGRACHYDPMSNPDVTCNVSPDTLVTCAPPSVASFVVTISDPDDPLATWQNCAACRTDRLYGSLTACSPVSCGIASDCPQIDVGAICSSSVCIQSE